MIATKAISVTGIDGYEVVWSGHAIDRAKERVGCLDESLPTARIVRQGKRRPIGEQFRLASGSLVLVCERIREQTIHIVTVIPRLG